MAGTKKKQPPFSIQDGQRDIDGNVIRVCDVCGMVSTPVEVRHRRCAIKIPKCRTLVRRWAEKALQREVRTKKRQDIPAGLRYLARAAKVDAEAIVASVMESRRARSQP